MGDGVVDSACRTGKPRHLDRPAALALNRLGQICMSGTAEPCCPEEKPRSGGTPGFPKRTIRGLGGCVIVLLRRTPTRDRQFRLHVPNQRHFSARIRIGVPPDMAAPVSTGSTPGLTRIAKQTDGY
jgi:hypothetical protein